MTATAPSPVPAIGTSAPEFSLATTAGETVNLAGLLEEKSLLLAFFPLAFTSTCTEEVCAFSEDYDRFAEAGVTVLPVSVDSVPTLREFRKKYGIRVDMGSDFRRQVSRAYGVLHEERFHSIRSYFLIDREGTVRWAHVETKPGERRHTDEIMMHVARQAQGG